MDNGSGLVLIVALPVSGTSIIIRHLSIRDDPTCITFYFTLAGTLISSLSIFWLGWKTRSPTNLFLLITIGLLAIVAQFMMTAMQKLARLRPQNI